MDSLQTGDFEDDSIVVLGSSMPRTGEFSLGNGSRLGNITDEINELHEFVKLDYNGESSEGSQCSSGNAMNNFVKVDDQPSMGNLMIASNIVTSSSAIELQHRMANLLDENNILREALKQNNASIKEQFKTIVSWRDDVMKTYSLHKNKFAETKELIEKLKQENVQQKKELDTMQAFMLSQYSGENMINSTTSYQQLADDSQVEILTGRLETLEKEKRRILHENEELNWQKGSLQNIVDTNKVDLQELINKLKVAENDESSLKNTNKNLEDKISYLQEELKHAQYKLSESENLKLEHSQYRQSTQNVIEHFKIEVQELKSKLKDAYLLTVQPVRFSLNLSENYGEHYEKFTKNIETYDKILKDLAADLSTYTNGFCSLFEDFLTLSDTLDSKIQDKNVEEIKTHLNEMKNRVDTQHKSITEHNQKIKIHLTGFEILFNDFQDVVKILKTNKVRLNECSAKLIAKHEEVDEHKSDLDNLRKLVETLQKDSDQLGLLNAQLDVYKTDFEAERKSRTDLANDKQSLVEQLRALHLSKQKLVEEYDRYRQSQNSFLNIPVEQDTTPNTFTEVYSCPICLDCFDSPDTLQRHCNSCIDKNG